MIAAGCDSTLVVHLSLPVRRSTAMMLAPLCAAAGFSLSPKISSFPCTAGLTREMAVEQLTLIRNAVGLVVAP